MRRLAIAAAIVLTAMIGSGWSPGPRRALAAADILVTSSADEGMAECPGPTCTLRQAIETANADAGTDPLTIGFDVGVFPVEAPSTISIGSNALPALTRENVVIDGSDAGVLVLGTSQNLSGVSDGLVIEANGATVRGLAVEHFTGACLRVTGNDATVGGDSTLGQGNRLGNCGTGIDLAGSGATARGNAIGFAGDGSPAAVDTGIQVSASNARIGDDGLGSAYANTIGNAQIGIRVGAGGDAAFAGTRIARNSIGRSPDTTPAPVTRGVEIEQPSTGTLVSGTSVSYAQTGIAVAAEVGGVFVTGNTFQQDTFHALSGLAIDLNADGLMNPNDDGDADVGANGLLNHPVITKAVQSRISGSVGASCAGCSVQLYTVEHQPGSPNDYGSLPVAGATVTADAAGGFAVDTPAVTPGQWVAAIVTDAQGNTSEFGPSARVGAGVAQCGNVTLVAGWNHVGYFGQETAILGTSFPTDGEGAGAVTAIYRLRDGNGGFDHWIAGAALNQTLTTLEPGEAYWFYAERPVTLAAGFSLSVALPVTLNPGWNDIVYIGAAADVRDALTTIAGKYSNLFRWLPGQRWTTYGAADTPTWAREFTTLETCSVYELYVTAAGVLTPLQP